MDPERRARAVQTLRTAPQSAGLEAELMTLAYAELRELAGRFLRRERASHTLQPTALVHEAWLRLAREGDLSEDKRSLFVAYAAQAMRRVLIEHARRRAAARRGAAQRRVTLSTQLEGEGAVQLDLLALDEAIGELSRLDARQASVVELRYFGGLSMDEVAELLRVSKRTAEAEWTLARAWLKKKLAAD